MRGPETKADRAHHGPLSEPALKILGELPHTADNPYIFPGRNPGAAMVNIERPWYRIRDAAGLKDVRLHDLRRTVGSWLAQQGNSLHLIGRVLNHSNLTTTQVYAHFGEDHVRVALEHHAERLLSVVKATDVDKATESSKPGQSCKVIPFKPRASNSSKFSKAQ